MWVQPCLTITNAAPPLLVFSVIGLFTVVAWLCFFFILFRATQAVSATPTGQAALQISTGSQHACALTFDADLVDLQHLALKADTPDNNAAFLESLVPVCWGSGGQQSSENLVPPAIGNAADGDPVVSVRAGDGFTCVRTYKGRVQCSGAYGSLPGSAESQVPEGVLFSALTAGEKHVAGVVMDTAELRAWGDCSSLNECTAPTGVSWAGAEGSLSAGRMFTCALDTQLRPHCWGRVFWPRGTPAVSEFIEINSGMSHTCGIRRNDTRAACWGECSFGEYVFFFFFVFLLVVDGGRDTVVLPTAKGSAPVVRSASPCHYWSTTLWGLIRRRAAFEWLVRASGCDAPLFVAPIRCTAGADWWCACSCCFALFCSASFLVRHPSPFLLRNAGATRRWSLTASPVSVMRRGAPASAPSRPACASPARAPPATRGASTHLVVATISCQASQWPMLGRRSGGALMGALIATRWRACLFSLWTGWTRATRRRGARHKHAPRAVGVGDVD